MEDVSTVSHDGRWEFHLLHGKLFITSEINQDTQIKLDEVAVHDLLEYLYQRRNEISQALHANEPK